MLVAAVMLSACGSVAPSPTPTPAPATPTPLVDPFPSVDVPMSGAPAELARIWEPYQVVTIPGRHVPDSAPKPPQVVNETGGMVSNDTATQWARAFFRDQAWMKWAAAHDQEDFLPHVAPSFDPSGLGQGSTLTVPDCALYPSSMHLVVDPQRGVNGDETTYAFLNTYNPGGTPCAIVANNPDGTQSQERTVAGGQQELHFGALVEDPLLGEVWMDSRTVHCGGASFVDCPALPASPPAVVAPPALPAVVTPLGQASPQLQAFWRPYGVSVVPSQTVLSDIPAPPDVDNQTHGAVDSPTAKAWAGAVMRDAAWTLFAFTNAQLQFEPYVGADTYSFELKEAVAQGGKPDLQPCSLFPTALTLQQVTARDRQSGTGHNQYEFVATYRRPCDVTLTYANGTTKTVQLPDSLVIQGQLRSDPLLGDIWFPQGVEPPNP